MSQTTRAVHVCCVGVLCMLASDVSAATLTEYSAGHADIGLAYADGELDLHYHFGGTAILDPATTEEEFNPSEAYIRVSDDALGTVTASSEAFFNSTLGSSQDDTVFILPQSNNPLLPFLGFATEDLLMSSASFASASFEMTAFSSSSGGQFALWQNGAFGPDPPIMQTNDGVSDSDTLNIGMGGHDHYNFGFTEEGVYDVTLTATAMGNVPGGFVTDTETFRFVVGNMTAVPEPSSMVALAFAGTAAALIRRRRRSTFASSTV